MGVRWYGGASGIQSGRRGLAPVRSVTMRDEEGDPRATAAEVEGGNHEYFEQSEPVDEEEFGRARQRRPRMADPLSKEKLKRAMG